MESRRIKGKRPVFFTNPESDKLLAITMAVAGELSVLHDRLDSIERLLETKAVLTAAQIEAYRPDDAVRQQRSEWREDYLARILRVVREELESEKAGESHQSYQQVVTELEKV